MKKLQNRKGFTLVELLIVMAIIGILIMMALPRFTRSTQAATLKTLQSNARMVASAAQVYYADKNDFPKEMQELIDGKYIDGGVFQGANARPKGATYTIVDNAGATATRPTGGLSTGEKIKAEIKLDQLPVDSDPADDFTTVAADGTVTVSIPFK